ncbi:flagellar export chaperone FliS [Robertmurraya korlensis]|uniref:flagellar export chaperone FliS n=1 Tax=Robertmurraya korlensis TaxID=519977 RepID=UPI002040C0DD|nr:flagellar export chaperone FliS [Robertmurraya korlensis]MCM3602639.1 flagellar export chaperone FliS [Robertmurraya korlensis]
MAINNPYQAYQQNSLNTASPGELTLMLYNGCLKFINQAKVALQTNDMQEKNTNLIKAQKIIQEFMITLNMDVPLSKDLMAMYDYIYRRLVEANIKNDVKILDEVSGFVTEYRDTWKQVIQINRQKQFAQGGQA